MEASTAILGVSPGTRTMGLAVIRDGELIEWRVKTFKGNWSKGKLDYILGVIWKMCDYFSITTIAIKKVDPLRSSVPLDTLTKHIIAHAEKNGMPIASYSLPELSAVSDKKVRNKHSAVAEYALDAYPAVRREYLKEKNNERKYYSKMFEAVLCAHMSRRKGRGVV